MKKTRLLVYLLTLTFLSTSCIGSYSTFNSLKNWNKQVSDSKFVNNLLFWGLWIVPAYELSIIGDTIIFNVIEFWSGSNPIAMNEGDMEKQTIEKNGNTYEMIATKNQMDIEVIKGKDEGESVKLTYEPEEKTWYAQKPGEDKIKLSSMKDGFFAVYLPDGEEVDMNTDVTRQEGTAIIKSKFLDRDEGYTLTP